MLWKRLPKATKHWSAVNVCESECKDGVKIHGALPVETVCICGRGEGHNEAGDNIHISIIASANDAIRLKGCGKRPCAMMESITVMLGPMRLRRERKRDESG
jgi:hypothetical protein